MCTSSILSELIISGLIVNCLAHDLCLCCRVEEVMVVEASHYLLLSSAALLSSIDRLSDTIHQSWTFFRRIVLFSVRRDGNQGLENAIFRP